MGGVGDSRDRYDGDIASANKRDFLAKKSTNAVGYREMVRQLYESHEMY